MVCAAGLLLVDTSAAVAQQLPNPEGPLYPFKTVRAYDSVMHITTRRVYWVAGYTDRFSDSTGFVLRKLRHTSVPFGPVEKRVSYYPNGRKRRVIRSWSTFASVTRKWTASGQLYDVWRERLFDREGYGIHKHRQNGKMVREYAFRARWGR